METPAHERGAHALVLRLWHAARRDQPFGAAANSTIKRPNANLAGPGLAESLAANLSPAVTDIPKRLGALFRLTGQHKSLVLGLDVDSTVIAYANNNKQRIS
jgi:hypothetical protein